MANWRGWAFVRVKKCHRTPLKLAPMQRITSLLLSRRSENVPCLLKLWILNVSIQMSPPVRTPSIPGLPVGRVRKG